MYQTAFEQFAKELNGGNTMKLYYIARAFNLYLICGPFLTEAQAEKALGNYNGSIWGNCIIVSREK